MTTNFLMRNLYNRLKNLYEDFNPNFFNTLKVEKDGLISIFISGKRIDLDEKGNLKKEMHSGKYENEFCALKEEENGWSYAIADISDLINEEE